MSVGEGYDEDDDDGEDENEDGGTYRPVSRAGRCAWRAAYFCTDPEG